MPTLSAPPRDAARMSRITFFDWQDQAPARGEASHLLVVAFRQALLQLAESSVVSSTLIEAAGDVTYRPGPPKATFELPVEISSLGRAKPARFALDDESE